MDYDEINTFTQLDEAYNALPWWQRLLSAFGIMSFPDLEEVDRRLSAELYEALDYCPMCGKRF